MEKEFLSWHLIKKELHERKIRPFFNEMEVWFTFVGVNVGDEEDGGDDFIRPVLIIKKFNQNLFWGISLTKTKRIGTYYLTFRLTSESEDSVAILSQFKLYDAKRLAYRIGAVAGDTMNDIKQKIRQFLA